MNKVIGSILLSAGVAIGGGTLALPIIVAGMGFSVAAMVLIGIWLLSFLGGLFLLEVNLAFKAPGNGYASMAKATLGRAGKWLTSVLFVLLLYALTSAYISGGSSLIQAGSQLLFGYSFPQWLNTILYTLVLGGVVAYSTRAVDLFNRGLFSVKIVLLLAVFIVFLPQVNVAQLLSQHQWPYAAASIPVIFTAFGSQLVIPSLAQYMNRDVAKLRIIVFFGSFIPLAVYLVWIACLLGTIPYFGENSLSTVARSPTQVESLMYAINASAKSPIMTVVLNLFSHVVIMTSFLGCSLSLFDFLRDKKHRGGIPPHRIFTALLAFVPPLLVGLFYPDALVKLLSYASVFAALLLVVLPAVMAWRLRRMPTLKSLYRVPGGTPLVVLVILLGFALIATELLRMSGYFAVWMG